MKRVAAIRVSLGGVRLEIRWKEDVWGKNDVCGGRGGRGTFNPAGTHRGHLDSDNRLGVGKYAFLLLRDTTRARLLEIAFAFG